MSLNEIEAAIGNLTLEEFDQLRARIPKLTDSSFDARIAADLKTGKLDNLINRALDDEKHGRVQPL